MKKILMRIFICFMAISLTSYGLLRYSSLKPFKNIRELIVSTAMTTMSHQWIAKTVASKKTIDKIMENKLKDTTEKVNVDEILIGMGITNQANSTITPTPKQMPTIYKPEQEPETEQEPKTEQTLEPTEPPAKPIEEKPLINPVITVNESYEMLEDGIYIKDVSGNNFKGKLMLVTDPSRVFVATTKMLGIRGDLVKQMVPANGGIAGINGGWFIDPNYESEGGIPTGFVIQNGELVFTETEQAVIVGFTYDNALIMGQYTIAEALAAGVRDCMSTSPIIIVNGEGLVTTGDGGWGIAPRTAIAQRKDGAVLLLTIDGRQTHSLGATLRQIQDVLLENEAYNAIMLDGGSSTTMYYNGQYLNKPSLGWERYIPTCFVVKASDK